MSTNNNQPTSPLEYPLNSQVPVKIFRRNRSPTSADYRNFKVRDFWNDTSDNSLWYLTSKTTSSATWIKIGSASGDIRFIAGDSGGDVPPDSNDVINLLGGTSIVSTGVIGTNTITIDADSDLANSYDTDSGTAVPVANVLTLSGGTNINTAGAGSTVTTNLDSDVLGLTDLTVDNLELNGNTLSSTDTNGNINITPDGTGTIVSDSRGYDVNPGSDIDADLITVGVTDSPTISWDESADGFRFNKPQVIGATGDLSHVINGATVDSDLEVHSEDTQNLGGITIHRHTDTALYGAHIIGLRSNGTHASPTIVTNGDTVTRIIGCGYDGTDYSLMAEIQMEVDGTPGTDDMPGRILFLTSPDGSQTPIEALRLDNAQDSTFSGAVLPVGDRAESLGSITNSWDNVYADGVSFDDGTNVLAAYEEGTWTPQLEFGGATTGITYTTQVGTYTRIGRAVYLNFDITLSSKGTATGGATITGIPFTSAAVNHFIDVNKYQNLTYASGQDYVGTVITASSTTITLNMYGNNTTVTQLTDVQFANTTNISGNGFYFV